MFNDYDAACRRRVKAEPLAFLRWLFPDFDKIARHVGWVDTRRLPFPGKENQTGDVVFEIGLLEAVAALWALALEFQIEPDPDIFGRMLIYLGTLWCERRPDDLRGSRYQFASSVVNLTGTRQSAPASASFVFPGNTKMSCVLEVNERYLAEESAEELLAAIAAGLHDRALLPWIPLMQGGSEPTAIAETVRLAKMETNDSKLAGLGYDTLVFAVKSADPDAWQIAFKGWAMVKSPLMEQTRAEGRVEGRVEGQQQALLLFLRIRSKQEVPKDLVEKIQTIEEVAQLEDWIKIAATVNDIADFRQQTGL